MTIFSSDVVNAVLSHMNGDHDEDNVVIVRAFGQPNATAAVMTGFDGATASWQAEVGDHSELVTVPWPNPVTDRAGIRREVVNLYDQAVAKLGLPPRSEH